MTYDTRGYFFLFVATLPNDQYSKSLIANCISNSLLLMKHCRMLEVNYDHKQGLQDESDIKALLR